MVDAAADGGGLPARQGAIRPIHVADLLSREGHPLAAQLFAARESIKIRAAVKSPDSVTSARRTLGVAAGALLVVGTVVASALGLNNSTSAPPAAAGEPVGALPSTGQPGLAPVEAADEQPTVPSSADPAPRAQVALSAPVAPVVDAQPAASPGRSATKPPPHAVPTPTQPTQNPPRPVTEPVGQIVRQVPGTLRDVVAPVTDIVDDTLTPALSLIGGLVGR